MSIRQELEQLNNLSRDGMCDAILSILCRKMDAHAGFIAMHDKANNQWRAVCHVNEPGLQAERTFIDQLLVNLSDYVEVTTTTNLIFIENYGEMVFVSAYVRTVLIIPIVYDDTLFASIYLDRLFNDGLFDKEQVSRLSDVQPLIAQKIISATEYKKGHD